MSAEKPLGRLLYEASRDGDENQVDTVLKKGADVSYMYWDGWTPIHVAAMKGNTEIINKLVMSSAAVEKKDEYGETPLQIAERRGNAEAAELLRKAEEDVRRREAEARKSRQSQIGSAKKK